MSASPSRRWARRDSATVEAEKWFLDAEPLATALVAVGSDAGRVINGTPGAFVVSKTVERVRPLLKPTAALREGSESLADTPFATMPDPSPGPPLKRTERRNVVFLLATSQLVEILVVASVGATMYLILGLIVLTPRLLKEWTHNTPTTSTVFGMTFPAPDSLMCLSWAR